MGSRVQPTADCVGTIPGNNHKLLNSGLLGGHHHVLEKRHATKWHQRFGNAARQGCNTAPVTCRENQTLINVFHGFGISFADMTKLPGGCEALGAYSKYSILTSVVPKKCASVTLCVESGNQRGPLFWYTCTKCVLFVQNEGFLAGLPSARTSA